MYDLKRCPVCGGAAMVIHMFDTYDRADYGWDAGCGRAKLNDWIHPDVSKVLFTESISLEYAYIGMCIMLAAGLLHKEE